MAMSAESTRMPRRLMFVSTALTYGGAEQQVVYLATGMRRRGWDVTVVSMTTPEAHVENLRAAGVEVVSLDMRPGLPDPRAALALRRHFRVTRPMVVHSHMVHANLLARVARIGTSVPVLVSTAHNIKEGPRWREIAYRLTDPLTDLTTNVSRAAVARYIDVGVAPARKMRYVPNGIDLGRFSSAPGDRERVRAELEVGERPLLLSVGRFEPAKDHAGLLRAFDALRRKLPEALLLLVGKGDLLPEVQRQADALGLADSVRFLGTRDDMPALMNASDVFVMSSVWEGLPLVLLEASSVGLPIVATDVGGNAEIVGHEESGLIVPAGDPGALSAALERVLGAPIDERRRMGALGRLRIEAEYDIERTLDAWEAIYAELGRDKRGAGRSTAVTQADKDLSQRRDA
jgi:glycosyltransferase involved in cell wall biosynthesis